MTPQSDHDVGEPRNRTLSRGFAVLEAVADSESGLTTSGIVMRTGLDKSTVSRLSAALEELGFLHRRPDRMWVVGGRMMRFARVLESQFDLRDIAMDALRALRDSVNETVNLSVWQGVNVVYVEQLDPDRDIIPSRRVGAVMPLQTTAMGRAILFALPEGQRAQLARRIEGIPVEPELRLTPADVEVERRAAVERGFVTITRSDDLERVANVLIGGDGRPVGAIGVYGPKFRMQDRVAEIGAACAATAQRINRILSGTE